MQALLFDMKPRQGHEDHYFRHAAALRPLLDQQEGLVFIERFKSLDRPGVILSHSLWRDEASIAKWRTHPRHNASQAAGRNEHFENYRIRIAHVLTHAMPDEPDVHESDHGGYRAAGKTAPRYLTIVRSATRLPADNGESFVSTVSDNRFIYVMQATDEGESRSVMTAAKARPDVQAAMLCVVSRDYGMFDRAEAPQYFPPVEAVPDR